MEEVKVNIAAENGEVVIRTGEALPLKEPLKYAFSGTIDAPLAFVKGKQIEFDIKKALVEIDRQKTHVKFFADKENCYGAVVEGKLEFHETFLKFRFNNDGTQLFSRQQLQSLIKLNSFVFQDKDKQMDLLQKIAKIEVDVQMNMQQGNDARGNKNNNFNKSVTTNIPVDVIFGMQIYKGGEPVKFKAEICYDATETGLQFWFESAELVEIINEKGLSKVDEIANEFKELGFIILEK